MDSLIPSAILQQPTTNKDRVTPAIIVSAVTSLEESNKMIHTMGISTYSALAWSMLTIK